MLALSGCSHPTHGNQFSLAPPPPKYDPNYVYEPARPPRLMAFTGQAIPFPSRIPLNTNGMAMQEQVVSPATRTALKSEGGGKKCSIKDRFDRGALLAYQWDQNRIGLNVHGLNMSDREINEVKVEYRLRLQPEVPRKERCRYASGWQGLIGSGYNEMFAREDDTVWDALDKAIDEAEDAADKLF